LQPKRTLVGMALDMPHLVRDPHLQAREFFAEAEHPVAGRLRFPGAPFKMSATPWSLRRPAPLLGQHNEEIYLGLLGHEAAELQGWMAGGVI
jgi:CoA:oxalate CoA-transferase